MHIDLFVDDDHISTDLQNSLEDLAASSDLTMTANVNSIIHTRKLYKQYCYGLMRI